MLADVSPNKNKNSTYSQTQESKDRIIKTNIKYCKKFGLKITEQDKTLPIMYWLPKMHKTSIDARFIVASKSCITKPLSEMISKVFKMIFNHVEVFVEKGLFYTCFRKF